MTYEQVSEFIFTKFIYKDVYKLDNEIWDKSQQFQIPIMIYVRDETEHDAIVIDFQMHQAKQQYDKSNGKAILFTVSDIKEGYQKEFFDVMSIYDIHLPLVRIAED